MGFHTGRDGSLQVGGVTMAKVASWSMSSSIELRDISKVGDCDKTVEPGPRTTEGQAVIWYYDSAPKALLERLFNTGDPQGDVTMRVGWGSRQMTFKALVTSAQVTCAVGEVMQATVGFRVQGAMTSVTL